MQVQVISLCRTELHNQACLQKHFSYSVEVNSKETSPWGWESQVGLDQKTGELSCLTLRGQIGK